MSSPGPDLALVSPVQMSEEGEAHMDRVLRILPHGSHTLAASHTLSASHTLVANQPLAIRFGRIRGDSCRDEKTTLAEFSQ